MQYLGGKKRIAKQIADVIAVREANRGLCVEPFMGGGSVTVELARHFKLVLASDSQPDLIMMWKALSVGWDPPTVVSREIYECLRNAEPSAFRAFVGFGCSFAGRWFQGYAKDNPAHKMWYAQAARNNLLRDIQGMGNVLFSCADYQDMYLVPGATVYADPPYANTKQYDGVGVFKPAEFWDTARAWRKAGMHVYVSEYTAPDDWTRVWSREITRNLKGTTGTQRVVESLYV